MTSAATHGVPCAFGRSTKPARENRAHRQTCLLLIDTQNYVCNPEVARRLLYLDAVVRDIVLPNLRRLIARFRAAGAEVLYTVMENMTRDGRERSLDYKLSNFFIAKGSWEAKVRTAGRMKRPKGVGVRR